MWIGLKAYFAKDEPKDIAPLAENIDTIIDYDTV